MFIGVYVALLAVFLIEGPVIHSMTKYMYISVFKVVR